MKFFLRISNWIISIYFLYIMMKKSNIKGSTCFYQFIITSCMTLHTIIGYKPWSWLNLTVATYLALAYPASISGVRCQCEGDRYPTQPWEPVAQNRKRAAPDMGWWNSKTQPKPDRKRATPAFPLSSSSGEEKELKNMLPNPQRTDGPQANVSWSNTAGPPTPVAEDALFSCSLTDENWVRSWHQVRLKLSLLQRVVKPWRPLSLTNEKWSFLLSVTCAVCSALPRLGLKKRGTWRIIIDRGILLFRAHDICCLQLWLAPEHRKNYLSACPRNNFGIPYQHFRCDPPNMVAVACGHKKDPRKHIQAADRNQPAASAYAEQWFRRHPSTEALNKKSAFLWQLACWTSFWVAFYQALRPLI